MRDRRIFCPLQPCLPVPLDSGRVTAETVRESASFPTTDSYLRHIKHDHLIAPVNAPKPLRVAA